MSSDMLTVGSALRRAETAGSHADVLIEGQWMLGRVERVEGDSAILMAEDGDEIVIRLASVSAVRLRRNAPAPGTRVAAAPAAPVAATTVAAPAAAREPALVGASTVLDAALAARHRA